MSNITYMTYRLSGIFSGYCGLTLIYYTKQDCHYYCDLRTHYIYVLKMLI